MSIAEYWFDSECDALILPKLKINSTHSNWESSSGWWTCINI